MQVMTVVIEKTVKFLPSSRRKPGSSVVGAASIPVHAGSEWEIPIACDPPTQQSSHAGDDGCCCGDRKIPTVIPAKAGIQRL
jgi:hypothetical protein